MKTVGEYAVAEFGPALPDERHRLGREAADLDYLRENYGRWRRFLDHAAASGMGVIRYFG